eukprot:COSAG01_NODE_15126_length_1371_cov_31.155660_1_plen_85_part_00
MRQHRQDFATFLMPWQVGVAVAGGMSMWSTVVEALLQRNPLNVVCAVDLTNCFNDLTRDELVAECLWHPDVPAAWPSGLLMVLR